MNSSRSRRWLNGAVRLLLAAAIVIGAVRQYRVSALTRPFTTAVPPGGTDANIAEITRLVGERMKQLREHGRVATPPPFPLATWADPLIEGGTSCGLASAALGTVLDQRNHRFRILQIDVRPVVGAGHIMVEALDDDGRWILLDPLFGVVFPHPSTGRLMSIEEVNALSPSDFEKLPAAYREQWPLHHRYRRTNWERLGPLQNVPKMFWSDKQLAEVSLRAWLTVERGGQIALVAAALFILSYAWPHLRRVRARRRVRSADRVDPDSSGEVQAIN